LIIVVCESVPTSVSGNAISFHFLSNIDSGEKFQVNLVNYTSGRRNDSKIGKLSDPSGEIHTFLDYAGIPIQHYAAVHQETQRIG
jgi:hypothetical protein